MTEAMLSVAANSGETNAGRRHAARTRLSWVTPLIAVAVPLAAVLACRPWLEMGMTDDFSYNQIALSLARTGHLMYNGWSMPILGLQAAWGALWIRLFGFSFTMLRLTTLPFFAGCALLLYHLGLRTGLPRVNAAFFTGFVTLSPLTIPLAGSFMTDIPALFFVLTCMVAALNAMDAGSDGKGLAWLMLLAAAGVLGGTIRQIVWICPIILIPYTLLRRPRGRIVAFVSSVLWLCSVVCAVVISRWYGQQPYAEALSFLPHQWLGLITIGSNALGLGLELMVLCLPILLSHAGAGLFSAAPRKRFFFAGCALVLASSFVVVLPQLSHRIPTLPFGYFPGNVLTAHGILDQDVEAIGVKPQTLPYAIQILVLTAATIAVAACVRSLFSPGGVQRLPKSGPVWQRYPASQVHGVCVAFLIPYLAAVGSRTLVGEGVDRYLLPIVVCAGLMLSPKTASQPTKLSWLVLFIFCLYGIATTHDYFARGRARLEAANRVVSQNISPLEITAGVEYDGWTELSYSGHLNDPNITNLPRADREVTAPTTSWYWFSTETPHIHPQWFVVLSRQPGLRDSGFPPVSYPSWLPPGDQQVFTQTSMDAVRPDARFHDQ
jgi:hypothetical protein